jgi:two-component system phosphate regulon sensor histidine kinase PhoR
MQRFNALENPARTQEYLGIAQHQLLQLSGMVDETLRLAAEERSHFNLKSEVVDIQDIVVPVMNHFLLQYGDNATIVFENLLAHPIHVDREHFSWAIKNLVDNALKYGPADHKKVHIKTWSDAAQWYLSVQDNGRGIPQEYQRRLFERFYRVPSDTNVKGFGLGLYIVRRIVEGHGGTIQVNSEPGEGSEFKITMSLK